MFQIKQLTNGMIHFTLIVDFSKFEPTIIRKEIKRFRILIGFLSSKIQIKIKFKGNGGA